MSYPQTYIPLHYPLAFHKHSTVYCVVFVTGFSFPR